MSNIISDLGLDESNVRWDQFAACNKMDTNWFYDTYETDVHVANQVDQICLNCPVAQTCYEQGVEGREFGVWGGIYLNLGRIDKSTNLHKDKATWKALSKIHGKHII
jgi:hypothetical protein